MHSEMSSMNHEFQVGAKFETKAFVSVSYRSV